MKDFCTDEIKVWQNAGLDPSASSINQLILSNRRLPKGARQSGLREVDQSRGLGKRLLDQPGSLRSDNWQKCVRVLRKLQGSGELTPRSLLIYAKKIKTKPRRIQLHFSPLAPRAAILAGLIWLLALFYGTIAC